jgi:VIT1/CCC1 family predicted Fe2+/Mn2+ transporter
MPEALPKTPVKPSDNDGKLSDAARLQILSTEHWSLLAGRSLAYNEAFSRAGMFLTFLSATLIVIGFLIGSQGLSPAVVPVAAVLLLADLYIGAATVGRLIDANNEELHAVRGMNRIRHAYREMVPGLEPYFVTSFHDDARGVLAAYGDVTASDSALPNIVHGLTTMIGMVATVVAMIVGALSALVAVGLGADVEVALIAAVVGFLLATAVFAMVGMRAALAYQAGIESRFPTPD